MSKIAIVMGALLALGVAGGCKKDDKKAGDKPAGEAKPADQPADKPADMAAEKPAGDMAAGGGDAAKPTPEQCDKVVAKQMELETDANMKKTMESSKKMMVDSCVTGMTGKQADCLAGAADKNAFAACLLQ